MADRAYDPSHFLDSKEELEFTEIRDANGNIVELPTELDPDWLEHMKDPDGIGPAEEVQLGEATGEEA